MYKPKGNKIAIFSGMFFVFIAIFFLNITKSENPLTGQVIHVQDAASLNIIFILIALIASGLVFITIYKKTRYFQ